MDFYRRVSISVHILMNKPCVACRHPNESINGEVVKAVVYNVKTRMCYIPLELQRSVPTCGLHVRQRYVYSR